MQKKKGISLIVLVITIIIMIILAATIIISLNNSGIISKANKAVKDTNEQELKQIANLAWGEAFLNGATDTEYKEAIKNALINNKLNPEDYGIIANNKGVKITKGWLQDKNIVTKGSIILEAGDFIQYDAGIQGYSGDWKILGAENGKLLLLSTEYIGSLKLYGLEGDGSTTNYGFLNGIARLNELCAIFGRGTGAVGARSIKVEDIDRLVNYNKNTYHIDKIDKYNNKMTLSWNIVEEGKIDYISSNGLTGTFSDEFNSGFSYIDFNSMTKKTVAINNNLPQITNTSYSYHIYNEDQKIQELIHHGEFWLASTCVLTAGYNINYMFRYVTGLNVNYEGLYTSSGTETSYENGVCAVVELAPDITIGEKDNTLGWSYTV